MNRNNVISDIERAYARILGILSSQHNEIALKILKKIYFKSSEINYTKGINRYFELVILILHNQNKFIDAIVLIKSRLKIYINNKNKIGLIHLYNVLGVILTNLNDFESGVFYLKKALEISINIYPIEIKRLMSVHLSLSYSYKEQHKSDNALKHIELGLSYFRTEDIKNTYLQLYVFLNINKTENLLYQNKIKTAKEIFLGILKYKYTFDKITEFLYKRIELTFILKEGTYDSEKLIEECNLVIEFTQYNKNKVEELLTYKILQYHYISQQNWDESLRISNLMIEKNEKEPIQTSILKIKNFDNPVNRESVTEDFIIFQKKELLLAAQYQKNFFQANLDSSNLNISTYINSAKTVSSDYLGTFKLDGDENFYLFVLADVVNDGISSTYISFMLDGIIKSIIFNAVTIDIKSIVKDINNILADSLNSQGYVSLWAGIVDVNKQTVESVNAGAIPAFIYTAQNKIIELNKGPTILGMFPELPKFESETIKFSKGDSIISFSEGVRKTIHHSEHSYEEIISSIFEEYSKNKSLDFNKLLVSKIEEFQSDYKIEDDITCLYIDYKNKN